MDMAPGTIVGAKFRLERPLSRGGMGSVWLARHVQLGSPVAVKFMDPSFAASPTFRARFEREARTAANLQSPYVVQVQDYGIEGDTPYLVMELLQGEDLGQRLKRCGRLPLSDVARIFVQAGRGLRRAHELGLVHRDLKPGNLFLVRTEDEEIVKILDFGIAKESNTHLGGEVTRTGEVIGSPHYMSPEQVRGDKALDHRSDLWSLGVILFRALTGALPFPGDVLGSVMAKILMDPIPRPTEVARDLHPALDGFFARALARDPAHRFQSVREMADELARIAGASPLASSGSGAQPRPMRPAFGSHPLLDPVAAMTGMPPTAPLPTPATLTGAGMGELHAPRARSAKGKWGLALGAVALLGVGATVTAVRVLAGSPDTMDTAVPAAAPDAPEAVAPTPPPAETAAPAPEDAPPPAPAEKDPAPQTAPGTTASGTPSGAVATATSATAPRRPASQTTGPSPTPTSTTQPSSSAKKKQKTWL